jgi:hypothetical protein
MKVEPVRGPKFASAVRKYGSSPLPATPVLAGHDPSDPLAILLTNYLLWESSLAFAEEALSRLSRVVVDANELRVMLEGEVTEAIGAKYPFVEERSRRLRATLNDVFRRQHRTSLDHLRNASRKDQRVYIEGLAEIPPFVAGRTLSVAFELPAPFVDDTTVELLHQQGVVESTASTLEVSQWIAKHHRLEELGKVNAALGALNAEGWAAAGKTPTKIRAGYLARHAQFRAAEQAERQRTEDEKREKVLAIERAAEAKRLAEVAREEERIRQRREAEEARIQARADREAARIAAVAAKESARLEREAERLRREAERARQAEIKRRAAEREAERRAKGEARAKARAVILARKASEKARLAEARKLALAKKQAMQRKLALVKKAAAAKRDALKKKIMIAKRAAIARREDAARKELSRKDAAKKKLALAKKVRDRQAAARRKATLAKKSSSRKPSAGGRKAVGRSKTTKRRR